jgi:DnaJ-class molecular chaperone
MNIETKTYSDGTTATGTAPIWAMCPKCTNHARCEERGCADHASTARAAMQDEESACDTCRGVGTIDETLGGEHFSNPAAPCPDCDGKGWL